MAATVDRTTRPAGPVPVDPFIACGYCTAQAPRARGLPAGWRIDHEGRAYCAMRACGDAAAESARRPSVAAVARRSARR